MKKNICLLLLSALLLVSCVSEPDAVSETESENVSSATESNESEVSAVFEENELIAEIGAFLSGNTPDRRLKADNLFAQTAYSYNTDPVTDYGDPNRIKLTDGAIRDVFDKWSWVGFKGSVAPAVTFDLGGTEHALADIEVHMLRQVDYGIELPSAVQIALSDDGENFTPVSTLQTPADVSESGQYTYRFALPETVSAQYVRVTLQRKADNFLFVDEIIGYEYSESGTIDVSGGQTASDANMEYDYYGYTLNTDITVPADKTDADYDERQNLALLAGVDVQVTHFDPLDLSYLANNTPIESLSMLIDGQKAKIAAYYDSAFAHFCRGCGRHIVIDLGNEMAVDEVWMEFLNQVSVGVGAPPAVTVSVSNDGESWVTAYAESTGVYGDRTQQFIRISGAFKQAYRCRYVRVSFNTVPDNDTSSNVYLSEIEVYGKKNAENVPEAAYDASIRLGQYPSPDVIGAENVLLAAVSGMPGDDPYCGMTEEAALLLLAYHDKDGKMTDVYFDSVLFAPTARFAFQNDAADSFELFVTELLYEQQNLPALDRAAKTVTDALPDAQKPTVWLNLMCPKTGEACRDVDGDGIAEDFSTLEGRFAYLKYQVDRYLAVWSEENYRNLELLGFYWNDEAIRKEELELNTSSIRMINDYIHSLGYQSIWCPYYNAYGYWMWQDVGFDYACLQPNYMFYATESTRLTAASDTAKIYGMGVELEIEDYVSDGSIGLYREYLRAGYDSGSMNSIKLYYNDGMPGSYVGSYGTTRVVYDENYLFARRKLDDSYNVSVESELSHFTDIELTVKHGRTVDFSLGDTSDYSVRIVQSTLYGTFRLNLNGDGAYRAIKNYRGTDTVIVEISDGAGNKKTVTITVTVSET